MTDINLPNAVDVKAIAIVVIGRNEGERLKKCLYSVIKSGASLVYVDSDSTDGSVEFAQSLGVSVVMLDTKKPVNASKARNAGFQWLDQNTPECEYIHFIDADCEMDEGWLEKAMELLRTRPEVAVVCGRLREKDVTRSVYTKICDMSWYIKPGEIEACGGIATIRRTVYAELQGYDESLIAVADPEFYTRIRRKNHKILCLDTAMGTHDSAMISFWQWWVRTVKTGFALANGQKWGQWKSRQRSIFLWVLIIPFFIITMMFYKPLLGGAAFLIYPFQIIRIAAKLSIPYSFADKLLNGFFCIVAKIPQLLGMVKYYSSTLHGQEVNIIEYKKKK